ncbi:MAG TPA: hypothetical protein V6D06_17775 [Trichocoleus sp.]
MAAVSLGLSLSMVATAARAEAPGVFYSWRALDTGVAQCLDQATQALESQSLAEIQADGNSVGGRTDETTAIFVCLEDSQSSGQTNPQTSAPSTTVMVIVAGTSDDEAVALREALKAAF